MKTELTHNHRLISEAGGVLRFVGEYGEVLAAVMVPPGIHYAGQFLDLCPDGASVELSDGLVSLKPRHRCTVQPYGPGATDTGANPDFRPTSARRLEIEMRMTLDRLKASARTAEARERANAKIERIPKNPPPEPLIDDDDTPAPAPAPAPKKEPKAIVE